MNNSLARTFLLAFTLTWATGLPTPEEASAQWRGRGGERGERGGRGDDQERRGRRGRGGPEAENGRGRGRGGEEGRGRGGRGGRGDRGDRADRFAGMMRDWDTNQDGYVERTEVPDRMRRLYDRMAERAGKEGQQRIKVDDLVSGSGRNGRNNDDATNPLDFGEPTEEAVTPGFGPGESETGSLYLASTEEEREAAIESASDLLRRYDRNRSRILEREEWTQISGTPANADTNRDGKISHTELVNRLIVMRRNRGTEQREDDDRDERSDRDRGRPRGSQRGDSAETRSYRFATAADRIPEAARGWITGKDRDGDGQVSMHEYATSWTDSRVREFARYDADGDGVVTPLEYLANK